MYKILNLIIFISAGVLALIVIEIIGTKINQYSLSVRLGFLTSDKVKILYIFAAIMQIIGIIASIIKLKTVSNRKTNFFIKVYLLFAIIFICFLVFGLLYAAGMTFPHPY